MRTPQPTTTLQDQPIPVRAKLAAAWTSFMFLYAYVDILGFFTPGIVAVAALRVLRTPNDGCDLPALAG
jgi:hypothetical protein